jgi:hypothetical protein
MTAVPLRASGYFLYLHILPNHFGKRFVAEFGPETFTFLVNVPGMIPDLGQIIPFAQSRTLKEAKVVSVVPTRGDDLDQNLTHYTTTVNAHPTDGTVIDVQTMHHLMTKGWKWLATNGRVQSVH